VEALARRGWSVASGASCTSDTRRPHHVLVAIGASTHGSLRVSLPPGTTAATLDAFAADLGEVVAVLRQQAGVTDL
jgi:cysteine desulfurase